MRTRYLGIAVLVLMLTVVTSCHKEPVYVNGPNSVSSAVMTANVNGYSWYAISGYAQKDASSALSIYAQYDQSNYMYIYIYPYNGPGSYQLNGLTKINYTQNGLGYTSLTGQVNITSDNSTMVEGNFNAQVLDNNGGSISLQISNGNFGINKQ